MEKRKERLFYIDNLRLLMITFVIMLHLGVTYSGIGSFYYVEGQHLNMLTTIAFGLYLSFQQGYFMGLLFMLAGYFTAGSYDRKGFSKFIKDRFIRLGIPALIYMVVITPFIGIVELRNKWNGYSISEFISGTGVMWFAVALFFFSLIYAVVRLITGKNVHVSSTNKIKPTVFNAILLILIISIFAFLIRMFQPIGTNILNMQLCFFASYIVLFIVGIIAYRNNLFSTISYKTGKQWLICGIIIGIPVWLGLIVIATKSGNRAALGGGFTWQSAGYSLWESFVGVAMSIGLIGVFREKFNHQSRLIKALSDSSFTVYMFHPPIIIAICLVFKPLALNPIIKWMLLCIICIPICFAAAYFIIRRIPFLKKVL